MSDENQDQLPAVVPYGMPSRPITELAVADPNAGLPAYAMIDGNYDNSLERQYASISRLRIAQALSKPEVKQTFAEGDVFIGPSMIEINRLPRNAHGIAQADRGPSFYVVPLFFYPEFIRWNVQGEQPAILERSLDVRSALAARCKHPDMDKRSEFPPGESDPKRMIRYVEHLNFVLQPLIQDIEPVVVSFARSEHKWGRKFVDLIKGRGRVKRWSCVFSMYSKQRVNDRGAWFGFNVENPTLDSGIDPWVRDPEWFAYLEQAGRQAELDYKAGRLIAEHDEVPADFNPVDAPQYASEPAGDNAPGF